MEISTKRHYSGQLYKYTNVMKGWQYRFFTLDPQAGLFHYYLCEGGEKVSALKLHRNLKLYN